MDHNLATKDWAKRFDLRVLCIVCIDAYLFYQQVIHADKRTTSFLKFFGRLADKLIDNQEGIPLARAAAEQDTVAVANTAAAAMPTIRWTTCCKPHSKRKHHVQGRCGCKECKKQSIYACSACTHATDPAQKQFWFYNPMLDYLA
jgi:hypothetical protein